MQDKRKDVKKVTVGKDVSSLFTDIVKTENLETLTAFRHTSSLLSGESGPLLLLGSHIIWGHRVLMICFMVVCFASCSG
jgi:hypothetical protein